VNLLANQLSGVLCQKLVESADGGLHLLVEHVENAGAMPDWIARRELSTLINISPAIGPCGSFIFAIDPQSSSGQDHHGSDRPGFGQQ